MYVWLIVHDEFVDGKSKIIKRFHFRANNVVGKIIDEENFQFGATVWCNYELEKQVPCCRKDVPYSVHFSWN